MSIGLKIALGNDFVVIVGLLGDPCLGGVQQGLRIGTTALVEEVLATNTRVFELAGRGQGVGVGLGSRGQRCIPLQRGHTLAAPGRVVHVQRHLLVRRQGPGLEDVGLIGRHSRSGAGDLREKEKGGGENGADLEVHVD